MCITVDNDQNVNTWIKWYCHLTSVRETQIITSINVALYMLSCFLTTSYNQVFIFRSEI